MRSQPTLAALLLSAPLALAQPVPSQAPVVLVEPPASQSCPVGILAQRRSPLQIDRAEDHLAPDHPLLSVQFRRLEAPPLLAVRITAHGSTGSSRLLPAAHLRGGRFRDLPSRAHGRRHRSASRHPRPPPALLLQLDRSHRAALRRRHRLASLRSLPLRRRAQRLPPHRQPLKPATPRLAPQRRL